MRYSLRSLEVVHSLCVFPGFSLSFPSTDGTFLAFDIMVFWTFDTGRMLSNFLLGFRCPWRWHEKMTTSSSFSFVRRLPFFIGFSASDRVSCSLISRLRWIGCVVVVVFGSVVMVPHLGLRE